MINKLRFENLTFGYEGRPEIFQNVNFDFPMSQTVWVRAASGAGRSSLLQIMAALQMPTTGKYFINDQDITELSFEEFLPMRLSIGYGFDYGGLINNRTIYENIILPLHYHKMITPKEARERVEYYLTCLNMTRYQDMRPYLVPGGVRKLACMVRAMVVHPELLLLDDPSVGLDQETALRFFDLIREIQKTENKIQHLYISSFDEKLMRVLGSTEIEIHEGSIFSSEFEGKKAASL